MFTNAKRHQWVGAPSGTACGKQRDHPAERAQRGLLVQVETELLVELVLTAASEQERPHLSDDEVPESHAVSLLVGQHQVDAG